MSSRSNRLRWVGLGLLLAVLIASLAGPVLVGHDPLRVEMDRRLQPPSLSHPFGTDQLGRDVLSRVVSGARVSLLVGLVSVLVMLGIGLPLGGLAGYAGGWLETGVMRLADAFLAFPYLLGAILVMAITGPGLLKMMIALGILGWPAIARVFRSSVMTVSSSDFVLSAVSVGAGPFRIIFRHIAPNAIGPVATYAALSAGTVILTEAVLSFLGIGIQPPHPSWGRMMAESVSYAQSAPWLIYFPGAAVTATVLGYVLLAEGMEGVASLIRREHGSS